VPVGLFGLHSRMARVCRVMALPMASGSRSKLASSFNGTKRGVAPARRMAGMYEAYVGEATMTSSPGSTVASNVALIASMEPQVTMISPSGS